MEWVKEKLNSSHDKSAFDSYSKVRWLDYLSLTYILESNLTFFHSLSYFSEAKSSQDIIAF